MVWFYLFNITVLSTTFINFLFNTFENIFTYIDELDFLTVQAAYEDYVLNIGSSSFDASFYALWHLSFSFSNNSLLWAILFDDLFIFNVFDIDYINTISVYLNTIANTSILYNDLPDYTYIYNSFIFDWSEEMAFLTRQATRLAYEYEGIATMPVIFLNFGWLVVYVYIFASLYFSYYGRANNFDSLIDHDYLLASATVEAEEEISSWDDMIMAVAVTSFAFLWYFGINIAIIALHIPEYYLTLYIFPVLYYIIMLIPVFLAFDFGIYFVAYLRGKGDSTISIIELMYDYIAFASFYIRLIVQNVRLLLMTFTFASFHEIVLIHEINKTFLFGDELYVDAWMSDVITFPGLCFSLFCQITTHIIYFFYELLHLLFVVTAQIIAFHAMVFWLFLFLYTMFSAELHEKFFFQKRLQRKLLDTNYISFKGLIN